MGLIFFLMNHQNLVKYVLLPGLIAALVYLVLDLWSLQNQIRILNYKNFLQDSHLSEIESESIHLRMMMKSLGKRSFDELKHGGRICYDPFKHGGVSELDYLTLVRLPTTALWKFVTDVGYYNCIQHMCLSAVKSCVGFDYQYLLD